MNYKDRPAKFQCTFKNMLSVFKTNFLFDIFHVSEPQTDLYARTNQCVVTAAENVRVRRKLVKINAARKRSECFCSRAVSASERK